MLHFIVSKSESHKVFSSIKRPTRSKSSSTVLVHSELATYNTRANRKREHISLNKKSTSILEEVTTLQGELKRLSTLVASLVALQNQPQFWQGPERQHQQHPRRQAPRMQFDPIPMKYAELFPILLLGCLTNCQRGIGLTFSVPSIKGHLTMILNNVMQRRRQSRI